MTSTKPVALVVGASRGIGRQVAVDLGRNGYAGAQNTLIQNLGISSNAQQSRRCCQDHHRPFQARRSLPAGPQLPRLDHHHRRQGDHSSWRPSDSHPSRCPIPRECRRSHIQDTISNSSPPQNTPPLHIYPPLTQSPKTYGRLDVLIYNSGAIFWAPVASTPVKRFQLMQRVNPEGLYATIQASLPHLSSAGGRIVVVSPPIYSRFFRGKTAYAMGKVGMSVLTKGLAMDFEREGRKGMAITSIWPAVVS